MVAVVVSLRVPISGAIFEARTGGCLRVALLEPFFPDALTPEVTSDNESLIVEGLLTGELDDSRPCEGSSFKVGGSAFLTLKAE